MCKKFLAGFMAIMAIVMSLSFTAVGVSAEEEAPRVGPQCPYWGCMSPVTYWWDNAVFDHGTDGVYCWRETVRDVYWCQDCGNAFVDYDSGSTNGQKHSLIPYPGYEHLYPAAGQCTLCYLVLWGLR